MSASDVLLPDDLVEFVQSGGSVLVATRDAKHRPDCFRGAGCVVSADRRRISIRIPELAGRRSIENIEAGSPVAATVSRPVDHRTLQFKGPCLTLRPATPGELADAERWLAGFVESLYLVGLSRAAVQRMRITPCVIAEIELAELFHQTPGPDAGRPMLG